MGKKGKTKTAPKPKEKSKDEVIAEASKVSRKKRTREMKNQHISGREDRTIQGFVVKEWQKLPKRMLEEHCQKQKLPRPLFRRVDCDEENKFRSRVVLPDPKGKGNRSKHDVVFHPNECFDTIQSADQYVSLLALKHLMGPANLEMKLPDPFREVWLSLVRGDAARVSNRNFFATQHEREQSELKRREKKNERNRKQEAKHGKLAKVNMTREHREMIESVITKNEEKITQDSIEVQMTDNQMRDFKNHLQFLGFHTNDIHAVLSSGSVSRGQDVKRLSEKALDWLMINVPEARLPKRFSAEMNQPRVLVAQTENQESQLKLELRKLGLPSQAWDRVPMDVTSSKYAISLLWKEYIPFVCEDHQVPQDQFDNEMVQEERQAEIVALQAIYGEYFSQEAGDLHEWKIIFSTESLGTESSLRLIFEESHQYPFAIPALIVSGDNLSVAQRAALHHELINQASSFLGEPMVHNLVEWVMDNASEYLNSFPKLQWPQQWIPAPKAIPEEPAIIHPKRNEPQRKPLLPLKRDEKVDEELYLKLRERQTQSKWKEMISQRQKLPMYQNKHSLMNVIDSQVVILQAETGSGKSTQVGSLILSHEIERKRGSACRIVCTQPRRLAATGLAERVAAERAVPLGDEVGYSIRLERKVSSATRLEFVTCGILLRRLTNDPKLEGISHVLVDEVHERSAEIDLLLVLLRSLLSTRPDLKLILMSATLDTDAFSKYFNSCPIVKVPGRTFAVQHYFLEQALEFTGYRPTGKYRDSKKSNVSDTTRNENGELHEQLVSALEQYRTDVVNHDLIIQLIWYIVRSYRDARGILVFVPGMSDITQILRDFRRSPEYNQAEYLLVPLHSSLTAKEQNRVFVKPKKGVRKIVISTPIAETSVTVEDVEFVIDSGRMKETQFDTDRKMAMLVENFVSQANGKQRKGRAGRVRAGQCFTLIKESHFNSLPQQQTPELHRVNLEHMCLQISLLKTQLPSIKSVTSVFENTLQPPVESKITSALKELHSLGCLDQNNDLTPLGHHLAHLPVGNVRLGKMLIYGAIFRCLTPVLCITALLSQKSPFVSLYEKRDEATKARSRFALGSSDHLTLYNVLRKWSQIKKESRSNQVDFCSDNFLSYSLLESGLAIARQYLDSLYSIGFASRSSSYSSIVSQLKVNEYFDTNSTKYRIVTAVVCAGLFPNVIRVKHPNTKYAKISSGALPKVNDPKDLRFSTHRDPKVWIHPASINFSTRSYSTPWMVYLERRQTSKVYIYDCSMISAYALLLFGGHITVNHEKSLLAIDEWIHFSAPARIAVLVRGLRREVDELLERKLENPLFEIEQHQVVEAILKLLENNGI